MSRFGAKSPPVHVHIEDDTPIHVHVNKPKKSASSRAVEEKLKESKSRMASSFGNTRPRSSILKSRSPVSGGPWVPPPGRTTRGSKLSWQGPSARLDIVPSRSSLRLSDLDTDEEDQVHSNMREYEKKIGSLMTEVGTLRNEADVQRAMREVDRKEDLLETSRRVMEDQEDELRYAKHELVSTETENRLLRRSMETLKDEAHITKEDGAVIPSPELEVQRDTVGGERDRLLRKLVEVEMDGQEAVRQLGDLKDTVRRMKEEKRLTSADSAHLAKQKELLTQSMSHYEETNRALRRLLREQHVREAEDMRMSDQRDELLRRLGEMDKDTQRQRLDILDKDRQLNDFRIQLGSQKEENLALTGLQTSLEQTRGHLQKQLRTKEGDCNRMAVQIRSLETQLAQERIEVDHLQDILKQMKDKTERDKEALKKATRVQKQRASRSEDTVDHLNSQLLEKEAQIAEVQNQVDEQRVRAERTLKERAQIQAENNTLKAQISEIESELENTQGNTRSQVENLSAKLHSKTGEASSLKLENERLRTSMQSIEDKLSQADNEVSQLRSSVKQYESLIEEYKSQSASGTNDRDFPVVKTSTPLQSNKSRREADDLSFRLEETSRRSAHTHIEQEQELEKVKNILHQRLIELEPLPELLKTTELRLQDANDKLLEYEKRNTENTRLITELTAKVELQNEQMNNVREKYRLAEDDVSSVQNRVEVLERKLRDGDEEKRDLLNSISKREETIRTNNMRLEEKTGENAALMRQLENALTEARQHAESAREAKASKERQIQSRLLELESQLSQSRAEIARIKRERDEAERKFNSRLYDLKDRLEQSHSTNRSMQNYVQFLKNSYSNVFGDTSISTSSPMKAGIV